MKFLLYAFLLLTLTALASQKQYLRIDQIQKDEMACLHKKPEVAAPSVGGIPHGTHCVQILRCQPTDQTPRWCQVTYFKKRGWIDLSQTSPDPACQADADAPLTQRILVYAQSKLGAPYRYGKTGPYSFDCSGFVYSTFRHVGISIPRTAILQSQSGDKLTRAELRPGDMVFFDTLHRGKIVHSGIYLGKGTFIHASSGSAFRVTISPLDTGFYKDKFRWGVRKIPDTNTTEPKASPSPTSEHLAPIPPTVAPLHTKPPASVPPTSRTPHTTKKITAQKSTPKPRTASHQKKHTAHHHSIHKRKPHPSAKKIKRTPKKRKKPPLSEFGATVKKAFPNIFGR